jgi:hypothetical protein
LCCKRIRTWLLAIILWREPEFLGTGGSWSPRVSELENMNGKVCRLVAPPPQAKTHLSRNRSCTMNVRWIHNRQRNINHILKNILSNAIYYHCSTDSLLLMKAGTSKIIKTLQITFLEEICSPKFCIYSLSLQSELNANTLRFFHWTFFYFYFIIWFERLLVLRPLLVYCASLG